MIYKKTRSGKRYSGNQIKREYGVPVRLIPFVEKHMPKYVDSMSSIPTLGAMQYLSKNKSLICWYAMSENKEGIEFLKHTHPRNIKRDAFSKNVSPMALEMFKSPLYAKYVDWETVLYANENPDAVLFASTKIPRHLWNFPRMLCNIASLSIFEANKTLFPNGLPKMKYIAFSSNEACLKFLVSNFPCNVNWYGVCMNNSKFAMDLLKTADVWNQYESAHWLHLSSNPAAIELLEEELQKENSRVSISMLSSNPAAMHLLVKQPKSKLDRAGLATNPSAISYLVENEADFDNNWMDISINPNVLDLPIEMLNRHLEELDWWYVLSNPKIFETDWNEMRTRTNLLLQGILMHRLHPTRMEKDLEEGYDRTDDTYVL